ncbi:predicted protein [Chaetoceros tenuissimus]|uniref:Uncharacterized protein n=1 Tax=Chaetoceros tenuissimus TaxID=426638 RepID=A0AAD3D594_9STRA|nr:predicted protein [Chaetoceros tenuissimus]
MKFTTAIALTALLGNAAFSNAQDATGNLDICNPDKATYADGKPNEFKPQLWERNPGTCNKVCERPQTGIRNQVKIQCNVDLNGDGKNVDCFDPAVSAGGCRDVDVKINYKYKNSNDSLPLEVQFGGMFKNSGARNNGVSWTAFDGEQVLENDAKQNETYQRLPGNEGLPFNIAKTINTCEIYLVEMKSKMPIPDDDKDLIWKATPPPTGQTDVYYTLKQRFCNKQYTDVAENENCKTSILQGQEQLDLSTDRCGVSGKILLCDAGCKAKWLADQPPEAGPSDPGTSGPEPDGPGPSDPAIPAPPTTAPPATGPEPDAPSPSSPKSKGTKEPSAGKGTKQPTIGKGTKQPTIGKGKGTLPPVTRKLNNRKVARV